MPINRASLWQAALLILPIIAVQSPAQESMAILVEFFDTTALSALPEGWHSSQRKVPGINDWGTTSSTTYSSPGAVLATNATLEQWLATPALNCLETTPSQVRMMVRRSGTFGASVVVEVSTDSGETFPFMAGTIPKEIGAGSYQPAELPMPPDAAGQAAVAVRWRVIPESTGTSGTFRMDDIRITSSTPGVVNGDSVIINEIMYAPGTGEPEWIEILNTGIGSSDLRGWSISDAGTSVRHVITGSPMMMDPGQYVVLTPDSSALSAVRPGIRSHVVQTDGFPSLNNGGDIVHLFSPSLVCRDSVAYQPAWGGGSGISLERIDATGISMEAGNWTSSTDPGGATPGRVNSMVRREHDLALAGVRFSGQCSVEACDIDVTVRNVGRSPALSWSLLLGDDVDRDSVVDESEVVVRMQGARTLTPGDSLTGVLVWTAPLPGKHSLRAEVMMDDDERQSNNGASAAVIIPGIPGSVRINEILYDPFAGMPEFVELKNASASAIDLDGCTLTDQPTSGGNSNQWRLAGHAFRLPEGGCLAVMADSSGPLWFPSLRRADPDMVASMNETSLGLNNDGDILVLKSADGIVLDSVRYDPSFHTPDIPDTKGRSLELIHCALDGNNGRNWGTCADPSGGTPAARNSVTVEVLPPAALLQASPNPFSPDGDGMDDVSVISFALPLRSSLIRVRVFDVRGRLFRDLANIIPAGTEGNVVWDGRDDQGRRGRIGVYIALIEAMDGGKGIAVAAKCAVVLAGKF